MTRRAAWLAALLLLAAACGGEAPGPAGAGGPPALAQADLPRPDLEGLEKGIVEAIEKSERQLLTLIETEGVDASALAEGCGTLGQVYHAHDLLDPAIDAYRLAVGQRPDAFRWSYFLALALHARGDVEAAAEAYADARSLRADHVPLLLREGELDLELQRVDAARERFEAALALEPESAAAAYGLGRALAEAGEHEAAIERFRDALRWQPEAHVVRNALAASLRALGKPKEAEAELALFEPGTVRFHDPLFQELGQLVAGVGVRLAAAERALAGGQPRVAAEIYRQAVTDDPGSAAAWRGLASVLVRLGETAAALDAQRKLVELAPEDAEAHAGLGTLLVATGRGDEAIAAFERAVGLDPADAASRRGLAAELFARGRADEARRHVDALLAADPSDRIALTLKTQMLFKEGAAGRAIAELERAVEAAPRDASLLVLLGQARGESGDTAGAERALKQALAIGEPSSAMARAEQSLARMHAMRGAVDAALGAYRRSLRHEPRLADVRMELAGLLMGVGRMDEAVTELEALLEDAPDSRAARHGLVEALATLGRHAEARRRLEEGLAARPGDPTLQLSLARLLSTAPDEEVRDGRRALAIAQGLLEKIPSPEAIEAVALALAETGDYASAARVQKKLLDELEGKADAPTLARLRAHLASYESGEPVRAR